jgi:hypothetical protein
MSKNKILIVLLMMLSIGIISLYTTYAYEDNDNNSNQITNTHYNLMYPLKESSNKEIAVGAKEEKFIDISLKNTYDNPIRYGMYYYMINPTKLPDNITITLSEDSEDLLEDVIKPNHIKSISIRITNDSEYAINLIIGALIGFEHGEIEELVTDGEVLIK